MAAARDVTSVEGFDAVLKQAAQVCGCAWGGAWRAAEQRRDQLKPIAPSHAPSPAPRRRLPTSGPTGAIPASRWTRCWRSWRSSTQASPSCGCAAHCARVRAAPARRGRCMRSGARRRLNALSAVPRLRRRAAASLWQRQPARHAPLAAVHSRMHEHSHACAGGGREV